MKVKFLLFYCYLKQLSIIYKKRIARLHKKGIDLPVAFFIFFPAKKKKKTRKKKDFGLKRIIFNF